MCSYTAEPGQKSPNRLDAMTWVFTELLGSGSLGLLDFFKSGKAEQQMVRAPVPISPLPIQREQTGKVVGATSLASIAKADETLCCLSCKGILLQVLSPKERRCKDCGHQWFFGEKPKLPLGG